MVQSLQSQIEISAPPSQVREIFLDFASFPIFHQGLTVTPLPPSSTLQPGDKIQIVADGTKLTPVILENTSSHFYWRGDFLGLLKGKHMWRFLESEKNFGGTTFVQAEEFEGILAFLFAGWWPTWLGGMRMKTLGRFEVFNGDFKRRVEELTS